MDSYIKKYTNSLKEMICNGFGYRNEVFSGSGYKDLASVVRYELLNLGHKDIVDTLLYVYDDFKLPADLYIKVGMFRSMYDLEKNEVEEVIEHVVNYISLKLNEDISNLEAVWLTTKDSISENYINGNCQTWSRIKGSVLISEYVLYEDYFPIADLGSKGALFVYKKKNTCIRKKIFMKN